MAIEVFNRYEKKFLISEEVYHNIQGTLLENMELDKYNINNELYTISNIYYDTEDNALIRNSLSKPKYKEKLRLRAYGVPSHDDMVFLEIKKKVNGLVNKRRTSLKLDEAYEFVNTKKMPEIKDYMNKQVLNEQYYFLSRYDLSPKVYLAYDRIAYFGKDNHDLRISFDTNIRTRRCDLKLESGDHGDYLLSDGIWLMEVKAEKNIPLWVSKMLSENNIYSRSFSKYGNEYKAYLAKEIRKEKSSCLTFYLPALQQLTYQSQPQF